jgi:histone deacetylase HOS3
MDDQSSSQSQYWTAREQFDSATRSFSFTATLNDSSEELFLNGAEHTIDSKDGTNLDSAFGKMKLDTSLGSEILDSSFQLPPPDTFDLSRARGPAWSPRIDRGESIGLGHVSNSFDLPSEPQSIDSIEVNLSQPSMDNISQSSQPWMHNTSQSSQPSMHNSTGQSSQPSKENMTRDIKQTSSLIVNLSHQTSRSGSSNPSLNSNNPNTDERQREASPGVWEFPLGNMAQMNVVSSRDVSQSDSAASPSLNCYHTKADEGPSEVSPGVSGFPPAKKVQTNAGSSGDVHDDIPMKDETEGMTRTPPELINSMRPITPPHQITMDMSRRVEPKSDQNELADFYQKFSKQLSISEPVSEDQTLILLTPLCYKHVFSRKWVAKRYLSSIVERPERLMACALGIGTAVSVLPSRFKIEVSNRRVSLDSSPHVRKIHGPNWATRLYDLCRKSPEKLAEGQLEVPDDWNYGDIYLTLETIDALEAVVGAAEIGIDQLFADTGPNRAFVAIRPPGHHSHPCVPSGFCLINNVHIAIQYARAEYGVTHAVILDFDLHHGDGSQDICWKLNGFGTNDDEDDSKKTKSKSKSPDPLALGYFSVHDINSFPTELGYATADNIKNASICLNAHGMCVWNVHLEPYKDEDEFSRLYESKYSVLFDKADQFLRAGQMASDAKMAPFKPLVVVSAGFDASEYENVSMQRHNLCVPTSFFHRFTADAVKLADKYAKGRLISLLEGGYSDAALGTGVFSHLVGLTKMPWEKRWSSPTVAKEYAKGCKLKWHAGSGWLSDGITLGRSLWPDEIKAEAEEPVVPATTGRRNRTKLGPEEVLATPSRVLRPSTAKTTRSR